MDGRHARNIESVQTPREGGHPSDHERGPSLPERTRQIVRRLGGLDIKAHVRRRHEFPELFGFAPPLPEQGVGVGRDDKHRASGEACRCTLVERRPGDAQGYEGLPEPDFVSEQNDLAAALVVIVVQAPQDGIDGALLPRCRLLHRGRIAAPECSAKRTPQVESVGTHDHGCPRFRTR